MKTLSFKAFAYLLVAVLSIGLVSIPVLASDCDNDLSTDAPAGTCNMTCIAAPEESIEISASLETEAVIGKDDRKIISDTVKNPYLAIAHITSVFQCGHMENGSGFLISDNTMLTAGHCVICPLCGYNLKSINCAFGYNCKDGSSYVSVSGCKNVYIDENFQSNVFNGVSDPEGDYAVVEFDNPVGKIAGHFGVKAFSNSDLTKQEFSYCGYTTDGQPLKQAKGKASLGVYYKVNGKKKIIGKEKLFSFQADVVQGNSGGPIFNKDNYISGIIIAESKLYPYNVGRRITKDLMKFMSDKKLIDSSSSSKPGKKITSKVLEQGKEYNISIDNKSELLLISKNGTFKNSSWSSVGFIPGVNSQYCPQGCGLTSMHSMPPPRMSIVST